MLHNKVSSVVKGTWGTSTIYSTGTELKKKDNDREKQITIVLEKSPTESSQASFSEIIDNFQDITKSPEIPESDYVDEYKLPYFQSSMFATIMEDTITEMRILAECNTEMRISKLYSDMGLLLALKFGVKQPAYKDELEGIDPHNLGCNEYKLNKLDYDRKYLSDVLLSTYKDLCLNMSYMALADHVRKIVDRDNYRVELQEAEAKNKVLRRELNRQLRQQRNHIKSVTYDTDVIIDDLRTKVEDSSLNSEICGRYVDNWEIARTEQHLQTIRDKEFPASQVIEYYKQRTDHEQRVHTEVELLINITINETLEKVEHWMNKYDEDMEKIDLQIQIKKNEYQNMRDERIVLEETIAKHDQLMKDWNTFKEEREKARQYREKMTNSAITVQAWWRGLLVRRQLGPFKPKPKPKKPKK